jgi:DNA modification methylase
VYKNKLKRNFIGIDLNPDYCIMAQERIKKENPPCEGGLQQFKID